MQNLKNKEIDLTKIWRIIKQDRKTVLSYVAISTSLITLIAIVYCLIATPIFTAVSVINPPRLTDASTANFIPSLAILTGDNNILQKADTDIATAILKSKRVSDMVIKKFNLIQVYKQQDIEYARMALAGNVSFTADIKSGFLSINVNDPDPKLAADIANFYTIALGTVINKTEYNRSKQKADFFTVQVQKYKERMFQAESALKDFSREHNITAGQQGQIITALTTQLVTTLMDTQSKIQTTSEYATSENSEYKRLQAKKNSLNDELARLSGRGNNGLAIASSLTPGLAQEYYNLVSDVHTAEELYLAILKRHQLVLVDTIIQSQPVAIQVIDPAQVPLHKSKPRRIFIVKCSMVFGIFVGLVFFVFKNFRKLSPNV